MNIEYKGELDMSNDKNDLGIYQGDTPLFTIIAGCYDKRKYRDMVKRNFATLIFIDLDKVDKIISSYDGLSQRAYNVWSYVYTVIHKNNKSVYKVDIDEILDLLLTKENMYYSLITFIKELQYFCEDHPEVRDKIFLFTNYEDAIAIYKCLPDIFIRMEVKTMNVKEYLIDRNVNVCETYFNIFKYVFFPIAFLFNLPVTINKYRKDKKSYNTLITKLESDEYLKKY